MCDHQTYFKWSLSFYLLSNFKSQNQINYWYTDLLDLVHQSQVTTFLSRDKDVSPDSSFHVLGAIPTPCMGTCHPLNFSKCLLRGPIYMVAPTVTNTWYHIYGSPMVTNTWHHVHGSPLYVIHGRGYTPNAVVKLLLHCHCVGANLIMP